MVAPVPASKLSLPDKITPNKRLFEAVLSEFEVTFAWSASNVHTLQLEVWIGNKRLRHTCTIATDTQASNSRAELRRKLQQINTPRKMPVIVPSIPPPPTAPARADFLGVPLSVAVSATRPDKQRSELLNSSSMVTPEQFHQQPLMGDIKDVPDSVEAIVAAVIEPNAEPIFPSPPPSPPPPNTEPSPLKSTADPVILSSRHLRETTILNAAAVIVLDLPQGLMVDENHVLIIPIDEPDKFTHMPKTYYQAMFRPVQQPKPRAESDSIPPIVAHRRPPAPPPVEAVVVAVPPKPKSVAEPKPKSVAEPVTVTVPQPPPPPVEPTAAAPPPPKRKVTPTPVEKIDVETRSVDGVSAQIARQMAAIAYATRSQGKPYVPVRVVFELLEERDYKQVSARMPHAAKLGFALRHDIPGEPLQFSITDAGRALLARLHTWPWEREKMALPKWANF